MGTAPANLPNGHTGSDSPTTTANTTTSSSSASSASTSTSTASLVNGFNTLCIDSADIHFGDSPVHYPLFTPDRFSRPPSSVSSDAPPSQMTSVAVTNKNANASATLNATTNSLPDNINDNTADNAVPQPQELPSLEQHLLDAGLRHPRFPDVTIHIADFPPISAHAIFLSRSPRLNALLLSLPPSPPYTLVIPASDPNLTLDALLDTLAYLYSPHLLPNALPSPATIISHIAACSLLGIYPPHLVTSFRSILLKAHLTPSTLHPFLAFLLSSPSTSSSSPARHPGPYPPFTTALLAHLINYIINDLPIQLQSTTTPSPAATPPTANTDQYKDLLVPLPFPILKHVLEHPNLPVRSEKQRYELAKQIVSKRLPRRTAPRKRTDALEECVVFKVGGGTGDDGVQLVRNSPRRRLWKPSLNEGHPAATDNTRQRRNRPPTT